MKIDKKTCSSLILDMPIKNIFQVKNMKIFTIFKKENLRQVYSDFSTIFQHKNRLI